MHRERPDDDITVRHLPTHAGRQTRPGVCIIAPLLNSTLPRECVSGLDPWRIADLPEPPHPRGLEWLRTVGPGIIALGVSIGSGEFLLGPAAFVQHSLSLLWVVIVAIVFQTIFNTEVVRYTLATGEPVFA